MSYFNNIKEENFENIIVSYSDVRLGFCIATPMQTF